MYGAILGDIIGEPYEFEQGPRSKDFPLFCESPVAGGASILRSTCFLKIEELI
ncbi:MAG: hypothetical protein IKK79_00050 [Spirochaetaceae bacterium]|nr:hypothetical protein [Spirochaetaceae bacterium]